MLLLLIYGSYKHTHTHTHTQNGYESLSHPDSFDLVAGIEKKGGAAKWAGSQREDSWPSRKVVRLLYNKQPKSIRREREREIRRSHEGRKSGGVNKYMYISIEKKIFQDI